MPADFSVLVFDLPVIYFIISTLVAPLLFLVAFSPGERPWLKLMGSAILASFLVVAGGLYLTYRVLVTWDNPSYWSPIPSPEAALASQFPGLLFHLIMLLVLGSALSFLIIRNNRDINSRAFLLASLVAAAICFSALIGFYVPLFGIFVPLFIPGALWEVYYEFKTRSPKFARHFFLAGLILVAQFFVFIVYLVGFAISAILLATFL